MRKESMQKGEEMEKNIKKMRKIATELMSSKLN